MATGFDWWFLLQLVAGIAGGLAVLGVVARFSPGGTDSLRRWTFWSMPLGAVTPCLVLIISIFFDPGGDHPGLAIVLLTLMLLSAFLVSFLVSLFLQRPVGVGWRFAIGFAGGYIQLLLMDGS